MLLAKNIKFISGNFSIGQKISCNKFVGGERLQKVEATIIGKYPNLALVTDNGRDKWCIKWVDFAILGIK